MRNALSGVPWHWTDSTGRGEIAPSVCDLHQASKGGLVLRHRGGHVLQADFGGGAGKRSARCKRHGFEVGAGAVFCLQDKAGDREGLTKVGSSPACSANKHTLLSGQ